MRRSGARRGLGAAAAVKNAPASKKLCQVFASGKCPGVMNRKATLACAAPSSEARRAVRRRAIRAFAAAPTVQQIPPPAAVHLQMTARLRKANQSQRRRVASRSGAATCAQKVARGRTHSISQLERNERRCSGRRVLCGERRATPALHRGQGKRSERGRAGKFVKKNEVGTTVQYRTKEQRRETTIHAYNSSCEASGQSDCENLKRTESRAPWRARAWSSGACAR